MCTPRSAQSESESPRHSTQGKNAKLRRAVPRARAKKSRLENRCQEWKKSSSIFFESLSCSTFMWRGALGHPHPASGLGVGDGLAALSSVRAGLSHTSHDYYCSLTLTRLFQLLTHSLEILSHRVYSSSTVIAGYSRRHSQRYTVSYSSQYSNRSQRSARFAVSLSARGGRSYRSTTIQT